jgi:hypothetical protein
MVENLNNKANILLYVILDIDMISRNKGAEGHKKPKNCLDKLKPCQTPCKRHLL